MSEEIHGVLCGPKIYEFDGWLFEFNSYCGPWPLRKDGELRKRAGRVFWKLIDRFCKLTDEEKKEYRVGGGCQFF